MAKFTKIHRARLLKLARHLEKGKLGHKRFDFRVVNAPKLPRDAYVIAGSTEGVKPYSCGYAGCAIGECPIAFPRAWKFNKEAQPGLRRRSMVMIDAAEAFFGLAYYEASHLFHPNGQMPSELGGQMLGPNATRKQVAANIRAFLKVKAKPAKAVLP